MSLRLIKDEEPHSKCTRKDSGKRKLSRKRFEPLSREVWFGPEAVQVKVVQFSSN